MKFSDFRSKDVEKKPGVYIIRYLQGEAPRHFRRLNGVDREGILCIGKSKNLRIRITSFLRDIRSEGLAVRYHSEGWNYRAYFRDNRNPRAIRLAPENMEVVWKVVASDDAARSLETQLIQTYVVKFQDKPPLNISIKRQR